ncbi:MFS transporter [Undibacterium sp. TS12]|uniref:MFS transporter n=1 Tax=Undibacterium sp. TS12 TaxID=2908202 RepID=UPI001F4D2AB5|nr:MFS transporter [Undibacterium sp. TS12]
MPYTVLQKIILQSRPAPALLQPLRHARYRSLWLANLVSNLGGWMQAYAASWLIASSTTSAVTATLVQAATWAPMMLFALPAGVLADAMHRARLLFMINFAMLLTAACMALLDYTGKASVPALLLLTFLTGAGTAFRLPAWQASMSTLVTRTEIEAAASLNNLSYNMTALAGPLLGAALLAYSGAGGLFLLNALSFLGLLGIYWQWLQQESATCSAAPDSATAAISTSLKASCVFAFQSRNFRQLLLYAACLFFAANAFSALLPLLVKQVLHRDAGSFGMLMACLGGGAVLGATSMPVLLRHFSRARLFMLALLAYGGMLLALGLCTCWQLLLCTVVAGGMAWSLLVTTLNSRAQMAFPNAIRARTISIYLLAAAAGQTLGSITWGAVAQLCGIPVAYMVAASLLLACTCLVNWKADFLENAN